MILLLFLAATLYEPPLPNEEARNKQIQNLKEITAARPQDVGSWHDLASVYGESGRWQDAIDAETHAIAGHPKFAVAYYGRGRALFELRRLPEARADFTKAIELWEKPRGIEYYIELSLPPEAYVDSYRSRAMAFAHEQHYPEALADLSTALRLRKNDAKLYYERGYISEKAGMTEKAANDFYAAGLLYVDARSEKQALDMAENLTRLHADDKAGTLRRRAAALHPRGDLP